MWSFIIGGVGAIPPTISSGDIHRLGCCLLAVPGQVKLVTQLTLLATIGQVSCSPYLSHLFGSRFQSRSQ